MGPCSDEEFSPPLPPLHILGVLCNQTLERGDTWHAPCVVTTHTMESDIPIGMAVEDETVAIIAREILRYLAERPDASDTAENIRRWWLGQLRVEEAAWRVHRALSQLVSDGSVVRCVLPDGGVIYSAAPSQRASTQAMR